MLKTLRRTAMSAFVVACVFAFAHAQSAAVSQPPLPRAGVIAFRGTLGAAGKTAIQMRLRREGDRLTGSYFYESVGKDLVLRGTITAAGDFTLQEFDPSGAQTGLFRGKWSGPKCEDCVDSLGGKWTRPDGTRALEFTLNEFPVYFDGDARLVSKPLKESRRRGKWGGYEISAEYPQLQGAGATTGKFNDQVLALVSKDAADYRKTFTEDAGQGGELDLSYYVAWADDSLVSLDFSDYFYYFGAGQRNAASTTFNYDLARGRALKLSDVFKPSSEYLKIISEACNRELRKQFEGESFPDAARIAESVESVVGDDKKWLVTKEGFVVVFDSTEFPPAGAGEHQVVIPYAALKSVIRLDGPLARFVKWTF